ncbi:MAG: sigma-54-dependent Fis family transcriptional regulator [Deltaproteobacteria bacterium]|nr:sigma-54-dependent Fis family transcriptional regulator [Deltaproteobacteria bacterium]
MVNILVVDDDKNTLDALTRALSREGYHVLPADTATQGLEIMSNEKIDLTLIDLILPGIDGLEFLKRAKSVQPWVMVIIMTGHASIDTAVKAIKEGAYDYLEKPLRITEIKRTVVKALEAQNLIRENINLKDQLREHFAFQNIIGVSSCLHQLLDKVEQIAPSKSTVLLTGQSGTGKELVAQAIHFFSPRAGQPFIKVSCAALPETLLESELFGHEKGAFTGAIKQKAGRFELAHHGTIFLDEIGEIPLSVQVKLLRVLQSGEFERLGGTHSLRVDVRIVAATNRDLDEAVKVKAFREDLLYRLRVIELKLPPLIDRKEDVPFLVHHFIAKYSQENGKSIQGISKAACDVLQNYSWPGNIRELENCIEHAVVMTKGHFIDLEHLPTYLPFDKHLQEQLTISPGTPLKEIEKKAIAYTLQITKGDKEHAAKLLDIGLATLYRKLKENENS